jgi:hypothetical protein
LLTRLISPEQACRQTQADGDNAGRSWQPSLIIFLFRPLMRIQAVVQMLLHLFTLILFTLII